ncbi:MAG: prolyl oligopeptidase family serine peptidase [Flavobacteriales bacterium]|nr:prolyl oligopeptidase family serine peptidase [Flavobacteriales bacterium]
MEIRSSWVRTALPTFIASVFVCVSAFGQSDAGTATALEYPKLRTDTFSYTRYGLKVTDPFRWMDADKTKEVSKWLDHQKELTKTYLGGLKYHDRIKGSIRFYNEFSRLRLIKEGPYYFRYINDHYGDSGPSVYYRTSINKDDIKLFDPSTISKKDRVSIEEIHLSGNKEFVALACSRNEREEMDIRVVGMKDGKLLDDIVTGYDYSDIIKQKNGFGWRGDGFYYCHSGLVGAHDTINLKTYDFKDLKTNPNVDYLYYHKLGTEQKDDKPIFANKANTKSFLNVFVTADERFLVVIEWNSATDLTNVFVDDFEDGSEGLSLALRGVKGHIQALEHINGRILLLTDTQQDNLWLAYIDLLHPNELVPAINVEENGAILKKAFVAGQQIITVYVKDDRQVMLIFDTNGKLQHSLQIDEGRSLTAFMGTKGDPELLITIESKVQSSVCGVFDLDQYKFVKKIASQQDQTDPDDYLFERHLFTTEDSVQVPVVTIRHKKFFNADGNNPMLLSVYGGYGLVSEPWFDPTIIYLLQNGGVYAEAHVRGGGELGSSWHKQGIGINKRNTINDLIGAAEFLIENNYTTPNKLAITGGSHGGFVVGAAVVKRPDLFRVAIPQAAMYNMVDDVALISEYGRDLDSTNFAGRYELSAYYQAKEANYPSMLLITAPNDQRVKPMESYKMTARLQQLTQSPNPVLLYQYGSGHGQAFSYTTWLDLRATILTFMLNEMGIKPR